MSGQFVLLTSNLRATLLTACVLSMLGSFPPARGAQPVAECLEPSTIFVARIDLNKFDLAACVQALNAKAPGLVPAQALGGVQAALGAALQGLRSAGAGELYVTLSTIELTTGKVALVVPATDVDRVAEQLRNLVGILPPAFGYRVHQVPGAAVACTDDFWNRRQSKPDFDSSPMMRAVEDQAGMHLSINIAIRDSLRQAVADIWPEQLPSSVPFPLSPKRLLSDVRALQVGLVSPPALKFELGVNCVDAPSAVRTDATLKELLSRFEVSLVRSDSREDRIVLTVDNQRLDELLKRFAPQLQNLQATMQESNNLKQLGLAVHNFHAAHGGIPPRMTVDAAGRPLLSWRVHLLPYINQAALYNDFHLDEPWSSPHNQRLIERMPATFRLLTGPELEPGQTCIQAVRMDGSFWNGSENRLMTFQDISDGNSNTVCFAVVPRDKAVVWTQPEDLHVDLVKVVEQLFGESNSTQVVFFDGSVQTIGRNLGPEVYRAWLTHAGGEQVERP